MTMRRAVIGLLCVCALALMRAEVSRAQERKTDRRSDPPAGVTVSLNRTEHTISGPYTHDHLAVYLIHAQPARETRMISLRQGVDAGRVRIRESGSVHELLIDNGSADPLYLQEGDRVYGGSQDRMVRTSVVVAPKSRGVKVPCMCVEQSRWSHGTEFRVARNEMSAPRIVRQAAKVADDQSQVWSNVSELKSSYKTVLGTRTSTSSLNEALDSPLAANAARNGSDSLISQMRGQRNVIGVAFAIAGEIKEVNVYGSRDLANNVLPGMIDAYAFEAALSQTPVDKGDAGAVLPPDPTAAQVAAFMTLPQSKPLRTQTIGALNDLTVHADNGRLFCLTEYQNRPVQMQWMAAEPKLKLEGVKPTTPAVVENESPGEAYLREARKLGQ